MNERWKKELHPELVRRINILIARAARDGYTLRVVSGYRSHKEQNELYAKGRTRPGRRVTNARGGQSWHNFGLAADLAPVIRGEIYWGEKHFNWSLIGRWANLTGLEWGGNWKQFKDRPHVQLRLGLGLADAQLLYRAHLNTLAGVWNYISRKALKQIPTKAFVDALDKRIENIKKLEPAAQIGVSKEEKTNSPATQAHHTTAPKTRAESQSQPVVTPAQEQPVQEIMREREVAGEERWGEGAKLEEAQTELKPKISLLSKLMIFWREALGIGAAAMGFVTRHWYWFLIALALIALAAWLYNESKKRADARTRWIVDN